MSDETINAVLAEWNPSERRLVVWYLDPLSGRPRETTITDATGINKRTGQVMTAYAHEMADQIVRYFKSREDLCNSFDPGI